MHSCPAVTGAFQSDADVEYSKFLAERIAAGVKQAADNLTSAKLAWGVGRDAGLQSPLVAQAAECRHESIRFDRQGADESWLRESAGREIGRAGRSRSQLLERAVAERPAARV